MDYIYNTYLFYRYEWCSAVMKYSLRQLEVFVAISRLGSVTSAADELCLSQSATSSALAEFERQFDLQLFDRLGKSLRINQLGQQLLPRAIELVERAHEIEAFLQGSTNFGCINIGATLTVGNYLATLIAAKFLQEHPESRIQLQMHSSETVVQRLLNHELDIGLIEGDIHHPDIEIQPWIADELVIFSAANHPLVNKSQVNMKQLLEQQWILHEKGSSTRETFDRAFQHHHAQLNIRLELEHTDAIKHAVASGLGIGCISRLALRDEFHQGSLVAIATPYLGLGRFFYFLWHRQKYQTTGMREFLDLCKRYTADIERNDLASLSELITRLEDGANEKR